MIMMIVSKMAMTDLYSHREINEDVMRGKNEIQQVLVELCCASASAKQKLPMYSSEVQVQTTSLKTFGCLCVL